MQTITVSRVNGIQANPARFVERSRDIRIRRTLDSERRTSEEFSIAAPEILKTQNQRLRGIATAVIRHTYPVPASHYIIRNGRIINDESNEERTDFARVWVGFGSRILFSFFGNFPKTAYLNYRLLVARCLTKETVLESQELVRSIGYNLTCVRTQFHNIWDQNFERTDAIRRGRIRGTAMETDPLYSEFEHIGSYIGVEIPISGSNQKVQVIQDGRVKFMALQAEQTEDPVIRDTALDSIIQVLSRLTACET